jgi:membrane protein
MGLLPDAASANKPPSHPLRQRALEWMDLVRHCARRFRDDQLAHIAGSLAFTTVLAAVPLAAVVFGAFSLLPGFEEWLQPVRAFLFRHLLPASGETVGRHIEELSRNAGSLTAFGAALLVVSALSLMATIERTFNFLWRVPRRRPLVQRLVTYWAVLTLAPALIGIGLALSSRALHSPLSDSAGTLVSAGLAALVEFFAMTLLFVAAPYVRVRVGHAAAGALFATILFEIAKWAFESFIVSAVSYQAIYGAIAALPLFMIWVYVSWMVCLLGAILTATLHERNPPAARTRD